MKLFWLSCHIQALGARKQVGIELTKILDLLDIPPNFLRMSITLSRPRHRADSQKCRKIIKKISKCLFWRTPEGPRKIIKKYQSIQNRPPGRSPGKCSRNCPREAQTCKKNVKILSQDNFFIFLTKIWSRPSAAPKKGRRPSVAALFWVHICFKINSKLGFRHICLLNFKLWGPLGVYIFDNCLGASRILDFVFLWQFLCIRPGASKSSILYLFCNFRDSPELLSVPGLFQCKIRLWFHWESGIASDH